MTGLEGRSGDDACRHGRRALVRSSTAVAAALMLLAWGCGGGGSPTAPPSPSPVPTRFAATLILTQLTQGTPRDLSLLFNGVEALRVQNGCLPVPICAYFLSATSTGWSAGSRHTVEGKVNAQATNTINYSIVGSWSFTQGAQAASGLFEERRATLRQGDTFRYEVSLP